MDMKYADETFKMGTFSDPQHTSGAFLYWSRPPWAELSPGGGDGRGQDAWVVFCSSHLSVPICEQRPILSIGCLIRMLPSKQIAAAEGDF